MRANDSLTRCLTLRTIAHCRQTKQVWSQCGDVRIGRAPPAQAALQAESATTVRPLCIGDSLGLSMSDCTAWVDIYDALDGAHWLGARNNM